MKTLNKKNLKKINETLNEILVSTHVAEKDYFNVGYKDAVKDEEKLKRYYFGCWMHRSKKVREIELFKEFGIGLVDEDDVKNLDSYIKEEEDAYQDYKLIIEGTKT